MSVLTIVLMDLVQDVVLDKPNSVRYYGIVKKWSKVEIRSLRGRLNLSQRAFSECLGVTENYVYLLERGVKTPSETLKLLLECVEEKSNRKGVK